MTTVAKWRAAHPGIDIDDAALAPAAPFPSLFANDFIVYLESKGEHGKEVTSFVRSLSRELVWAYDLATKAMRDNCPASLLKDLIHNASHGEEYQFTAKFLRDYAAANGIKLGEEADDMPWQTIIPPTDRDVF